MVGSRSDRPGSAGVQTLRKRQSSETPQIVGSMSSKTTPCSELEPKALAERTPVPWPDRLRRTPAHFADGRRGIGDALIDADAAVIGLGDGERAAVDGERLRRHIQPLRSASESILGGSASRPAKRAFAPSASSMRSASFHFAMRSDREKEPTFNCPAPQPTAR